MQDPSNPDSSGLSHQLLLRYEVLSLLGRGGCGAVYRSRDRELGREVALKVLEVSLEEGSMRERFAREAMLTARMSHPGIVRLYDSGIDLRGHPFLVYQLLDGEDLARRRAHGDLPGVDTVLEWLVALSESLEAMHGEGILHRDLKPANVIVTRDQRPVICDLGLALATFEPSSLTRSGSLLGTPRYMAPETLRGEPASVRSDVFGLTAIAYECLYAAPLRAKGDLGSLMRVAHLGDEPPLGSLPAVDEWLRRGLAADPRERPASAAELGAGFRRALAASAPPPTVAGPGRPPEPGSPAPPEPGSSAPYPRLGASSATSWSWGRTVRSRQAVLILALVAAGGFLVSRRDGRPDPEPWAVAGAGTGADAPAGRSPPPPVAYPEAEERELHLLLATPGPDLGPGQHASKESAYRAWRLRAPAVLAAENLDTLRRFLRALVPWIRDRQAAGSRTGDASRRPDAGPGESRAPSPEDRLLSGLGMIADRSHKVLSEIEAGIRDGLVSQAFERSAGDPAIPDPEQFGDFREAVREAFSSLVRELGTPGPGQGTLAFAAQCLVVPDWDPELLAAVHAESQVRLLSPLPESTRRLLRTCRVRILEAFDRGHLSCRDRHDGAIELAARMGADASMLQLAGEEIARAVFLCPEIATPEALGLIDRVLDRIAAGIDSGSPVGPGSQAADLAEGLSRLRWSLGRSDLDRFQERAPGVLARAQRLENLRTRLEAASRPDPQEPSGP